MYKNGTQNNNNNNNDDDNENDNDSRSSNKNNGSGSDKICYNDKQLIPQGKSKTTTKTICEKKRKRNVNYSYFVENEISKV